MIAALLLALTPLLNAAAATGVAPGLKPGTALPPARRTVRVPSAAYKNPALPVEARVADLLARMSLDEKVALLSGVDDMDLRPNARLGIPALRMTDGPVGVRLNSGENTTAFPAGILSASSFDPALMRRVAAAMGEETLALGRDMLLGPCINIARTPFGGRNFESFGEDPYLAARMGEAWVAGLQSRKVLASTKHFALNNQETNRMTVDVKAGERAIHEIFLPAFEAAVRAGTWSVMAAYNRINGQYASENQYLLQDVLKKRWGFEGFVVSDWGATHSTVDAANRGLDVEMPAGDFFGGGKLQQAVKDGRVQASAIDDKARRVLRAMIGAGVLDRKPSDRPSKAVVNSPAHRALALKMAQEGIVVLKNDGVLPLRLKSLAVLGPNAATYRAGGGSSEVPVAGPTTALAGLRERGGRGIKVIFAEGVTMPDEVQKIDPAWLMPPKGKGRKHGLYAEYFANPRLEGKPQITQIDPPVFFDWGLGSPWTGMPVDHFSIRWTGRLRVPQTAEYEIATRADDGVRLWIDGELVIDDWADHAPTLRSRKLRLEAGRDHDLKLEYYENEGGAMVQLGWIVPAAGQMIDAVAAAKEAEGAVIFAGVDDRLEGEGQDRASLELPAGQAELIEAVAKVNKNVVVVLQAGSPILMGRWLDKVQAVVQAWYPGEEGGRAIADVLLGRVNPSGKTPVTWPKRAEDASDFGNFPGQDSVPYAEGLYVGYRHFDKAGLEPLFPFGHGLSYTSFRYSSLAVTARGGSAADPDVEVSLDLQNQGDRAGAEVVQLYVRPETSPVDRPEQELKAFARVELAPRATRRVSFKLDRKAFAYYDEAIHDWRTAPGRFTLRVGASSRDIRLTQGLELR